MNSIYVLDQSFTLQGIIDEYASVIWRPAYYDIGDFEIYLGATDKAIDLLRENRYVVRSSDITVENGITTYKKVMTIKNLKLTTDVENGNYLTITGRELKYLLHQRIVWGQMNFNNITAESSIRNMINANAVNPVNSIRAIPNMVLANSKGFTERIEKQVSNTQLEEAVIDVCRTYNYGWDVYISNNKLTVELYKGVDRSYNQSNRPYVVFSDSFENIYQSEYVYNSEGYANMTLVGGEGEGVDRTYTTVNDEISGLERYEVFTDAKDISSNKGSEDEISNSDYLLLLKERGSEKLSEQVITEGFTGEVLSDVTFKYGVDFNLGDVVTVINEYGITKNVRVLSAIESEDENGTTLIPQFSI